MTVIVATTLTTFAMHDPDTWGSWLLNRDAIKASHPEPVRYFAAIEEDARGGEPFLPLMDALSTQDDDWWTYRLDDGRETVSTANRLRHIVMGMNATVDYTLSDKANTHLLFLAADLEPPPDCLPRLLALDHPIVGGHVPTYCLDGERIDRRGPDGTRWDVRRHMATAAFVLIARPLLRFIRWRWDLDAGMSDDPCLWHDARTFHGTETLVRHDVVGVHHPESIVSIESRFPGADMSVWREGGGVAVPDPLWVDLHAEGRGA